MPALELRARRLQAHVLSSVRRLALSMNTEQSEQLLLSIVIPAYNEAENIGNGTLQKVLDYLAQQDYASEVIVVDDGSLDGTAEAVEEAARRCPFLSLLRADHGGKAAAVRAGVRAARGRYVFFSDMDQSTPIRYLEDALRELSAGYDVVVASRWLPGSQRLGEPLSRRLSGRLFSLLVRLLLLPEVHDSQCGFKGFRREAARQLFEGLLVFQDAGKGAAGPIVTAFDVELLVQAKRRGYRIQEIPVVWRHVGGGRVSPLRDGPRMFRQVLAVWTNKLRGRYNDSAAPGNVE